MLNAIQFRNLTKIYRAGFWQRQQLALDSLELEVPHHCIYGFLGANGAGKTTAIKMLTGIQHPSSGTIFLFGEPHFEARSKQRIGYLPERPYFHDNLTANEFLNFHRSLYGSSLKAKVSKNEELLHIVGLEGTGTKRLRTFSKGMLQRIGIAQSLVNNPDLLVLDEPTSGLDPIGRIEIRNLIQSLYQQGKTIFFSSHILSDVELLCHHIAFLEKGKLKAKGSIDEILSQHRPQYYEILFKGIKDAEIQELSVLLEATKLAHHSRILAKDPTESKIIAEAIWKKKGEIISISPQQITLENVLFADKLQ